MTKKIFQHIIWTVVAVIFIVIGLFLTALYSHFETQINANLKEEAVYIETAYEEEGVAYLAKLSVSGRITLISPQGEVLFDNRADSEQMENHLDREEIKEALNNTEGYGKRRSDTLGHDTLYYAKLLDDGNILRLASDEATVLALLLGMSSHLFWIILLAILIAYLMAKRASDKLIAPINKMDIVKDKIAPYSELQPLVNRIQNQASTIDKQLSVLKQRSQEFLDITENMQEGLLVINKNAEVLSYNKSASSIFKTPPNLDKPSVYQFYHGAEFMDAVSKALKENKRTSQRLILDSRIYIAVINPVTVVTAIEGATILVRDVTEAEMQEKIRREFSANVSHELKTPLTSIVGFAEIMKNGLVDDGDVKEIANDIYTEAKHLINLINDIIHLSRIEDNNLEDSKVEFVVSDVVERVFATLNTASAKKNIKLIHERKDYVFKGVAGIFEEIIYNLCDNAIQYGRQDGFVKAEVKCDDDNLYITVEDNGIGIAPADQNRVFERFYSVDKSHSKKAGGTGLGLSIVKHGVILHGGTVELSSKLDVGSKFYLTFPLHNKPSGIA